MKTVIVYYGYGKHTKMIAERIKKDTGYDILEIKPKIPYSNDYQKVVDETEDNLESKKIPEIEDIDISSYDRIILGTPVWWYTITPPVRTFLKKYDLTGKTLVPFATNAGWLGSTFNEIKELTNAKVENEMSIKFTTDHSENKLVTNNKDIEEWINSIKE